MIPMQAPGILNTTPMLDVPGEMKKRGILDRAESQAQLAKENADINQQGKDATLGTLLGAGASAFLTAMNGGDADAFVRNINPSLQGLLGYGKYLAGLKDKSLDRYNSALKIYQDALAGMTEENYRRERMMLEQQFEEQQADKKYTRDKEIAEIRAKQPDMRLQTFTDEDGNPSGYVFDEKNPTKGTTFQLPGAKNENDVKAEKEIKDLEEEVRKLNIAKAKALEEKDSNRRSALLKELGITAKADGSNIGEVFDEEARKLFAKIYERKKSIGHDAQYIEELFKKQGRDVNQYVGPGNRLFTPKKEEPKKAEPKPAQAAPAAAPQRAPEAQNMNEQVKKSINLVGNVKQKPAAADTSKPVVASADTSKTPKKKALGVFGKYQRSN